MVQELEAAPAATLTQAAVTVLPRGCFADDQLVVFVDYRGRRNLMRLKQGTTLHLNHGHLHCDDIIGKPPGTVLLTSKGKQLIVLRPTLEEYIVLMPRAAQIISTKDIPFILQWADIFPGATVVEAGIGSGALSLGLLRALGSTGRLIAFEQRVEFANRAEKNIRAFDPGYAERLTLHVADVHEGLKALNGVDRIVLDLADPWNALDGAVAALNADGIMLAYLPGIRQVDQLAREMARRDELTPAEVMEVWQRPWVIDRVRCRPSHKILAHSGFLVRSRRRANRWPGELAETPAEATSEVVVPASEPPHGEPS